MCAVAVPPGREALFGQPDVLGVQLDAQPVAAVLLGGQGDSASAHERVEHDARPLPALHWHTACSSPRAADSRARPAAAATAGRSGCRPSPGTSPAGDVREAVGKTAKCAPRKLAVASRQTSPGFLPSGCPAAPRALSWSKAAVLVDATGRCAGLSSGGGYVRSGRVVDCGAVVTQRLPDGVEVEEVASASARESRWPRASLTQPVASPSWAWGWTSPTSPGYEHPAVAEQRQRQPGGAEQQALGRCALSGWRE